MLNKISVTVLCLFLVLQGNNGYAQSSEYSKVLAKVKTALNGNALQYRYRVLMLEEKSRKVSDSISGYLCKSGANYYDSSGTGINLLSGNYLFKSDRRNKRAYVYDLTVLEKKTGIKRQDIDATILSVPDSLLGKMGKISVSHSGNGITELKYTLNSPVNGVKELFFRLDKKQELLEIKMEVAEQDRWGEKTGYSRVFYLSGFRSDVPSSRFNTATYFRKQAKQVTLIGPYQNYKLTTVI